MTVSCGILPENKQVALDEILLQLDRMQKKPVSRRELRIAQKTLINVFRQADDAPSALQAFWFGRQVFYGSDTTPEQCIEKIKAVTAEDVMRVARMLTLDTVYFLNGTAEGEEGDDE